MQASQDGPGLDSFRAEALLERDGRRHCLTSSPPPHGHRRRYCLTWTSSWPPPPPPPPPTQRSQRRSPAHDWSGDSGRQRLWCCISAGGVATAEVRPATRILVGESYSAAQLVNTVLLFSKRRRGGAPPATRAVHLVSAFFKMKKMY